MADRFEGGGRCAKVPKDGGSLRVALVAPLASPYVSTPPLFYGIRKTPPAQRGKSQRTQRLALDLGMLSLPIYARP